MEVRCLSELRTGLLEPNYFTVLRGDLYRPVLSNHESDFKACPPRSKTPDEQPLFLNSCRIGGSLKKNWISWSLSKSFIFKRKFYLWSLRQWQPTPVLLPGKSHGRKSLVGCSPLGRYESDTTERLHFHALEKEMATHSSVLAWRIPGMAEPGGLPSMGSHRVGHD